MLTLVTPPAVEPITLAEAKLHLRLESTIDDALVTSMVTAARRMCEAQIKVACVTSTWDLSLDAYPSTLVAPWTSPYREIWVLGYRGAIAIPNPPLQSVTSLSYVDSAGVTRTLDPSAYQVVPGTPGMVVPVYGTTWPSYRVQPGAVVLRYVAGYGLAAAVPEAIKAAMKLLLTHLYENRGEADVAMPSAAGALLGTENWGSYG